MSPRIAAGMLALLVLAPLAEAEPPGVIVEVDAGAHDRQDTPILFPVPEPLRGHRSLSLETLEGHRPVDVQVLSGARPKAVWMLRERLRAGETRRFRLGPAPRRSTGSAVFCEDDGRQVRLEVAGRPVLHYRSAVVDPPTGLEPLYRRSGQIHPLLTPSGRPVTDDFPPDHAHQHGLFFAWVNTTFAGRPADFWNQKAGTGGVRHLEVLDRASGPVFGQFVVRLRHEIPNGSEPPTPVLNESWTVRAYNLVPPFVVDLESRQECAGERPLTVNRYHYGGLGVRGNREWFDPRAKGEEPPDPSRSGASDFLTSEGKGRRNGNHTRPRWVDLSGKVGDSVAGLAVLDDPENFRFPQPVRLHPNKPYFCFAPMVLGAFDIAPGRPYVSRYRFLIHDGKPDRGAIDRAWDDYADPPRVRIVSDPTR